MEKDENQGGGFDARILSLCSRSIGSGVPVNFTGENAFYSFYYYDAIKVEPVALSDCAQLKDAYFTACSMRKKGRPNEISQSIVAITDISSQPDIFGYTAEQVQRFWDNEAAPIFFVSMINLSSPMDLEQILSLIKEKFSAESHLAYLTFDHCDIIIFGRGDSFQRYTNCIFDLCYAGNCMPEDIITVYGFSNRKLFYAQQERETFQACIRLGIRDYLALDRFAPKCGDSSNTRELQGKNIHVSWLLGRNDVNLYCPSASLPWLSQVRDALIGSASEESWYTTYDLTVLAKESSHEWNAPKRSPHDLTILKERMDRRYDEFEAAYNDQYRRLTEAGDVYYLDQVWCRWLKESSCLAVSLIGTPLSSNFGTCLVPQFLDLLEYGRKLFGEKDRLLSQSEVEKAHDDFAIFFSNTAILVDSLNQTNRQFVQIPAFHLPSFEVPSQIMAYYTAMAYRILNVLRDKEDYFYGLSISPKLVNTLSVSSLALPTVRADDEWLDINMDEESFYTLKLTTETLGHEISHFVGEDNRNREKRKECIIQWAFQELVGEWYIELNDQIPKLFRLPEQQAEGSTEYPSWNAFYGASQALHALAQKVDEKYGSKQKNHRDDVKDLIMQVAGDIERIPELREEAFDQIWKILCDEPESQVLMEQVRRYIRWEIGLDSSETEQCLTSVQEWTVKGLMKDKLKSLFYTILEGTAGLFRFDGKCQNRTQQDMLDRFQEQVYYQFSETFADLQAILLLDMKWNDYCMLLKRDEDRELIPDCPPRMLAVTRALIDSRDKVWDPEKDSFTFGGDMFDEVKKLAFVPSGDFITSLYGRDFDPILIYYLTEYLKSCVDSIQAYFKIESHKEARDEIRGMYRMLSKPLSMFALQKAMLAFVEHYQMQCLDVK